MLGRVARQQLASPSPVASLRVLRSRCNRARGGPQGRVRVLCVVGCCSSVPCLILRLTRQASWRRVGGCRIGTHLCREDASSDTPGPGGGLKELCRRRVLGACVPVRCAQCWMLARLRTCMHSACKRVARCSLLHACTQAHLSPAAVRQCASCARMAARGCIPQMRRRYEGPDREQRWGRPAEEPAGGAGRRREGC